MTRAGKVMLWLTAGHGAMLAACAAELFTVAVLLYAPILALSLAVNLAVVAIAAAIVERRRT